LPGPRSSPSLVSFLEPEGLALRGGGAKPSSEHYFANTTHAEVIPASPLLDPDDPTDVELGGDLVTSLPQSFGTAGQGVSFDLGLAALYGEAWEIGLGATDLAGWIRWRTNRDGSVDDRPGCGHGRVATRAPTTTCGPWSP
jgi:hypothetical protein